MAMPQKVILCGSCYCCCLGVLVDTSNECVGIRQWVEMNFFFQFSRFGWYRGNNEQYGWKIRTIERSKKHSLGILFAVSFSVSVLAIKGPKW